ncbi:MAG: TldD/PmbA family protein [Sulfolobaceae archaeon]
MNIHSLVTLAKQLGIQAEVFYIKVKSTELSKEKQYYGMFNYEEGLGVRVIKDKRMGFSYGNKLDYRLLDMAIEASKVVEADEANQLPSPEPIQSDTQYYYSELEEPTEILKEHMNHVLSYSDQVNLTSVKVGGGIVEVSIVNTEGIDVSQKFSYVYVGIEANYIKDVVTPEVYEYIESRRPVNKEIKKIMEKIINKIEMIKKRRRLERKVDLVVLTPKAVNELFSPLFSHAISLENLYRGKTPLRENEDLGKKITIYDDPKYPDSTYSRPFDGEGLPTNKIELIRNGIVKNFLSNTYWSIRANKPNTHSSNRTYMSIPTISTSNIIIELDKISDLGDAIYIDQLQGVHTSDYDSGYFSVTASVAWDKEGGLRELVVTGDLKTLIRNILGGYGDIERYGKCVVPNIVVSNLNVI